MGGSSERESEPSNNAADISTVVASIVTEFEANKDSASEELTASPNEHGLVFPSGILKFLTVF